MIADLKIGSFDELELTIVAKEPARFLRTPTYAGLRSVAIGRDATGEILVVLYGQDAVTVELGDRVRITNGRVKLHHGDRRVVGNVEVLPYGILGGNLD